MSFVCCQFSCRNKNLYTTLNKNRIGNSAMIFAINIIHILVFKKVNSVSIFSTEYGYLDKSEDEVTLLSRLYLNFRYRISVVFSEYAYPSKK